MISNTRPRHTHIHATLFSLTAALALLSPTLFRGCIPPAPNAAQVACAEWRLHYPSTSFSDARGCTTYVRSTSTIAIADKAVNGVPYCIRAKYSTGYIEQLCVGDASTRLYKRTTPLVLAEVVTG